MRVDIKPLSVNQVWQGKRFKTPAYKKYEAELMAILPDIEIPDGPLFIELEWGFSSAASDWDNPIKPFQDVLQKRYLFNDSRVMEAYVIKRKVKKGEEYIIFNITKM